MVGIREDVMQVDTCLLYSFEVGRVRIGRFALIASLGEAGHMTCCSQLMLSQATGLAFVLQAFTEAVNDPEV